jgi:molybdenum cofactor guanylyltransferase
MPPLWRGASRRRRLLICMRKTELEGLILGGGKSSRMGFDKSELNFHGAPQGEFLFNLLRQFCEEVFFSCKSAETVPEKLNPLEDQYDLESPLNGTLSGFKLRPKSAWLTVPIDMPGINKESISYLLTNRDPNVMATCYYDSEGVLPEPLFCIWEPKCLPSLKKFYEDGNISPREFLSGTTAKLLKSPFANLNLNINSPQDLEKFRNTR